MHIAILIKHLGPRGGTEEYVRTVGTALLRLGHRVRLFYEEVSPVRDDAWRSLGDEALCESAASLAVSVAADPPDVLFVNNGAVTPEIWAAASAVAPIVSFVHDFRPVCLRVGKVLPLSRRNCERALGYGCLLHGCSVGPGRGGSLPVSWRRLGAKLNERDVCRRMDQILVASQFMRALMLRNGVPAERITVTPLFCSLDVPAVPPQMPSHPRLAFVGQIQKHKGLDVLLRALPELPRDVGLDVAGDGPLRQRCEALARRLGVAERVTFHGWVSRDRLPSILEAVSVVVVPSTWNEPFGLAGLEAMAHGRPVVAFAVGGISEWLEDGATGIQVDAVGPEPLATALRRLFADPDRARELGQRGHARVRERFTIERHLDDVLAALTDARAAWLVRAGTERLA